MAGRNRAALLPVPRIACAYDLCLHPAIVRMNSANLCRMHYDFQAERDAELFCDAQGLKTVVERRAWCAERIHSFGRKSFTDWAASLSQDTVDLMRRVGLHGALDKLRRLGRIDEAGKLVE